MHQIEKNIVIFLSKLRWKPFDLVSELISNIKFLVFGWLLIIAYIANISLDLGVSVAIELILVFAIHYIVSEGIIKFGAKKFSLARIRPYVAYPDEIKGMGRNFSDSSFPSSHMASVTGGLIVLYAAFPSAVIALIVFGLLLALSRLHNGMHYPSDILAGVILGFIYGLTALAIYPYLASFIAL